MKLPKTRTAGIVNQHLAGETLIYDTTTNEAFCLNETAALVYQACDGKTTFDEFKRRSKLPDDLIYLALDNLHAKNLLDDQTNYESPHLGISRREAVRRAGLASMAALPVISVLLAPTSAHAASAFAPGSRTLNQSCTTSTECASSASNCASRVPNNGQRRCCTGSLSYYDTGGVVNSCSGGGCSSQTFSCQSDANDFCCSGQSQASCTGNSCACRCV
jgi:hypothetical protein